MSTNAKKIMVVDDSALMRRVLSDIINSDGNFHAEYIAKDGMEALDIACSGKPVDLIVLDINMPRMDGLSFLRELKRKNIHHKVIVVSTLAKEGAKETIEALELGAFDFITKPTELAVVKSDDFKNRLLLAVMTATGVSSVSHRESMGHEIHPIEKSYDTPRRSPSSSSRSTPQMDITRYKGDRSKHSKGPVGRKNKLVALACSTGGPKALQQVIPLLPPNLDAPVALVQHMPKGFTASLAKRLDDVSKVQVKEAADGDVLEKGKVYIAKGGSQMRIAKRGGSHVLNVTDEPARNSLRPCADIMYESLMNSSYDEITCVVLTGMGADGTLGILQLENKAQIYVIAQDAATCTVYGMPRAIATADDVDEVVPLGQIADAITKHVGVL